MRGSSGVGDDVLGGVGVIAGSTGLLADVNVITLMQMIEAMTRASTIYTALFIIFRFV